MYKYLSQVRRYEGKALVWTLLVAALLLGIAVIFYTRHEASYPNSSFDQGVTEQKTVAGRINSFDGPVSAYLLKQQSQIVKVGFLVPVYVGDKIEIKDQNHTIELFLGGHKHVKVAYQDSPYTVKSVGDVPTPLDNVLQTGINLTQEHERQLKEHNEKCDPKTMCDPITTGTRNETDGDMLIPLLEDNPSQMVAGQRPLYLRWFGGESPYQVTISENGQSLASNSVEEQWIKTQELPLEVSKTYQVSIKDAKGQSIRQTFDVIATIDSPKKLQDSSLSPESSQTVWAMALAAQEQGLWMLEAYQKIAEIAEKHYPARLLRDRLEKGLRVVHK
ncbi:MAG: hypothetical protein VSS75_011365 [Candidatus Parabeggiatoa sp.]|nr:hypothetical protein [Candidatus Parabeggiatoa sp.]